MTIPVNQRPTLTLFDFVKAVDHAKLAGETGKAHLGANGELSFASSGISGYVTRLWEKFSDAVCGTTLAQQRHTQAQEAFNAFQKILRPGSQDSIHQGALNPSPISHAVDQYQSVSAAKMRQTLLSALQPNLPKLEVLGDPRVKTPATLTAAFKNVLHHATHTLTQTQRDKNAAYARRDKLAADVVLVIGPDTDDGRIESMKNECKKNGLRLLVIGNGRDPIPLIGMGRTLNGKVDKWTQFFVSSHGGTDSDGKLILQTGTEKNNKEDSAITEASLIFSAIQGIRSIDNAEKNPNYVTHVYACHGGAAEKSIHSSADPGLQNTPFLLHAATNHKSLASRSRKDMLGQLAYLARCKAGGYAPLPAAQLAEAAFLSVESARLVVAGREKMGKGRVLMPATKGPEQSGQNYIATRFEKMKKNAVALGITEQAAIFGEYENQLLAGAATVLSELSEDEAWPLAVDHGNLNAVRAFLEKRPELKNNIKKTGISLPFTAALLDHPHMLDFYKKEHGLDLNGKNSQRQTLLMTAVANNSFGVVTYLLEQKVDLSPKADGLTALSLAVKQGSLRTTKMLVEHLEKNSDSKTIETALREAITVARKNKNATVLEFLEPRLSAIKKTTPAGGF